MQSANLRNSELFRVSQLENKPHRKSRRSAPTPAGGRVVRWSLLLWALFFPVILLGGALLNLSRWVLFTYILIGLIVCLTAGVLRLVTAPERGRRKQRGLL